MIPQKLPKIFFHPIAQKTGLRMEFFSVQIFHDAGFSTERPKTRLSDGIFLFRSCCVTAFVPPEGRKTGLRMEFFFSTFFSCVAGPCVAYLISCGLSDRKVKVFRIKGRKGPLTSKQKKGIRKKECRSPGTASFCVLIRTSLPLQPLRWQRPLQRSCLPWGCCRHR